jgi:hypothetical protein
MGALSKRIQITSFPCRHTATLKPGHAPDVHLVSLQNFNSVAPDLGLVVLNVASLEKDDLAPGFRLYLAASRRPFLKRGSGEVGQQFVTMNAEHFLQKDPMQPHAIRDICNPEAGAGERTRAIGIA